MRQSYLQRCALHLREEDQCLLPSSDCNPCMPPEAQQSRSECLTHHFCRRLHTEEVEHSSSTDDYVASGRHFSAARVDPEAPAAAAH